MPSALVTGAGGFIGSHLVRYLKGRGYWVRGVDIAVPDFEDSPADEFVFADLRIPRNCRSAVEGVNEVYHLAADMGGIGYITAHHADVATNNVLMDTQMLHAASRSDVDRYFYASSACVYPAGLQDAPRKGELREADAIPADPERGYGWEKLFAEQLADYYLQDLALPVRVGRFHNIYGPQGTFTGGREKAPAAICRKVAMATDRIEIWGDGQQTRSFTYIDDCVEGIYRLTQSAYPGPVNIGSSEEVSIAYLASVVMEVARRNLDVVWESDAPQGVRGRNSDNTLIQRLLGWEPTTTLREGIEQTYPWVAAQLVHA